MGPLQALFLYFACPVLPLLSDSVILEVCVQPSYAPVSFRLLSLQQGIKQTETFVLRTCHRWWANKVNPFHEPCRWQWGLGEEGREHWGGVLMEGYGKVSIWGYVWLFSKRFIWMLNQELAVGIPGGRAYTQAKEGMEKDSV